MSMRLTGLSVVAAAIVAAAVLCVAPAWANPSAADTARAGIDTRNAARPEPAVVFIANRQVFVFRANLLGYPPELRRQSTFERLEAISHDDGPGTVTAVKNDLGMLIEVDGRMLFLITKDDVDPLSRQTFDQLVAATRADVEQALLAMREQRSMKSLIRALLRALLATLIMARVIQYLRRLVRWMMSRTEAYATHRVSRLNLPPSAVTTQLIALLRLAVRIAGIAVSLVVVYGWLAYSLDQFPYTSPWGQQMGSYLQNTTAAVLLAIVRSVPGLLMVIVIFALARLVVRWLGVLLVAVRAGRLDLPGIDVDTALPTQRLIVIFIWVLAVALAFPFIPGSGGEAFKGISVLFGLMVSLGASSVVGQAASGYILMYSRSLRVGDYVRIGEHEGTVMSISMLSTKIRTPRDEEINVPNSVIVSSITRNFTRLTKTTGAVLSTTVTIGYGTPWRQVHAMLVEAAGRAGGIRKDAKPRVLQGALSDFYVEYTLLVRLEKADERAAVASELHAHIQDVFNEHGVQIMSPHYENDPPAKVWVPKEKWHEPPGDRPLDRA